ncbi:MAG: hypothetical protein JNM66_16310 [Bryobacterales bacterium]|nr:hypothetical protein [Bryobacterales bacterium]
MTVRLAVLSFASLGALMAQAPEPVFFSWHAVEYVAYSAANRDLTVQLHFRTTHHFAHFSMLRGSIYGSQQLPKGWNWNAGYLRQAAEGSIDQEWNRQQRVFSSLSRPFRHSRLRHTPRFQYDYLYDMNTPAYGRYRFAWQTEWTGRVRPYAGVEEFVENAGVQRFRPRAGVRFQAARYLDTDFVYVYDRIYRRGNTNRHILQTTFTFHRSRKD